MKKVVLGLLVLLSVDVECMKLSMCREDPEIKEFLIYRLLKVAPDATVNEVVNWVEEGANSLRPSLGATPARVRVTGVGSSCVTCDGMAATSAPVFATAVDAPTDVGGALRSLLERLRLVEDERRMMMEERDEARVMLSRLKAELNVAVGKRDEATATLRTRLCEAFDNERKAKRECDDLESELRLLYGTLETAGYSKAQKGADVVKKSDFDAALASRWALTAKKYAADGSDLTDKDDVYAALASRQALIGKKYAADGSDLTDKDDVYVALASRQALTAKKYAADGSDLTDKDDVIEALASRWALIDKKYAADGSDLTDKDDVIEALGFLGMLTTGANAHLSDISYLLLRAVFASDLTLDIKELKNAANPLSQLGTVDDDAKVQGLPNARGLDRVTLQDPASDMVKFALLRGFFYSATYANHDQADLDGVDVYCTDGPISLGAGGLGLKVTH